MVQNHRSLWRGLVVGSQRSLKIIHRNAHVRTPEILSRAACLGQREFAAIPQGPDYRETDSAFQPVSRGDSIQQLQPFKRWLGAPEARCWIRADDEDISIAGADVVPVEMGRVTQGLGQGELERMDSVGAGGGLAKPEDELIVHEGSLGQWPESREQECMNI